MSTTEMLLRLGITANYKGFLYLISAVEMCLADEECLHLVTKQVYPQVAPGYHMNKTHWNTVTLNAGLDDDALNGMIAHSYDLTAPRERERR